MSFRIKVDEDVSEGLKRIVAEQCDKATERLKAQGVNRDEAIHDARVCFKKIRAVLRLAKEEIGEETYKRENLFYRDAGRRLSSVRDAAAAIETIDKLTDRFSEQLAADPFDQYRSAFLKSKRKRQVEKKKALSEVRRSLGGARRRIATWPLQGDDFQVISQGLKRVYKAGRLGLVTAYDRTDVESFHEWRKQVKYLFYQVRITRGIWKSVLNEMADELKKLAGYLSDMHDLFILRQKVIEQADGTSDDKDLEVLVALIDERIEELQVKARPLGKRIYAEKPKDFVSRLEAYWKAWRAEEINAIAKQTI